MKTVYQVFWMPSDAYKGGIAKILDDYIANKDLFFANGFDIRIFNHQINKSFLDVIPFFGSKLKNIRYLFSQRKSLLKQLKNEKDAIVHLQTSRKWTFFRDLLLAKFIKKKTSNTIFMTIHFAEPDKVLYSHSFIKKIEIKILNNCVDRIIFLGHKTRDEFVSVGVKEDICRVLYTFHHYELNEKPSKDYDPFKLMFMGSLDERKGIIDLMNAMLQLSDRNIILDICGGEVTGNIKETFLSLKSQLGDRVKLNGYVSGENKLRLLKETNIFILPSYGEGMPIVLMEAMATGCGIISTTVGCVPELVSPENGILVLPGNVEELVKAILFLYNDRKTLIQMENKNFEDSKKYSVKANVKKLCGYYSGGDR